jgi:stage II sporulation protein AA (anti-sigma F factor antagonist)
MEIREERNDGVLVVAATGRIDTTTSDDLERRLLRHVEASERRLVVDMAGVEYISSAGLRVLLLLAKKLRAVEGELVLCALGPAVRQVFELAGFLPIFRVEASRERALARLAPPR